MKNLTHLTLIGMLSLGLVACGGGDEPEPTNGSGDTNGADVDQSGAADPANPADPADATPDGEATDEGGDASPTDEGEAAADPTTPLGSARLFVQSMAAGDYTTVADIVDPASPAVETFRALGERFGNVPAFMREMFTAPYERATVSLVDQMDDTAIVRIEFADREGESIDPLEDVRLTQEEGVWLVTVQPSYLVADPVVQKRLREMSGADEEADGGDGGDDAAGDQPSPPNPAPTDPTGGGEEG